VQCDQYICVIQLIPGCGWHVSGGLIHMHDDGFVPGALQERTPTKRGDVVTRRCLRADRRHDGDNGSSGHGATIVVSEHMCGSQRKHRAVPE
jgi:hypothetical protein